ncbi:elongin-A [Oreochromis aureus]|uniref:TFIIS N-terminal domain-containing protein n=1 Tax=Oreochromis aureus TaxID=47969 RepID=A0A668VPZ8_OREAU|nr:elongin-A [Oreochromis aureus]
MAEELLETVERLQSRLQENQEPRKLLKTLKRLGELPMTVDILVETGVGKAVNSFRKHELAGEMAKNLVAKWKKLVPQSGDRPNSHGSRSHTQARGHEASGRGDHKRPREPSPEEDRSYIEEEEEERGYHTNYSPSPPQHDQYSPPQRGGYHSDEYESPEPEPEPEPSPPPPPPPVSRKDVRHTKPNKEPSKNHHHHSDRNRDEERRQRHAQTSSEREGGGSQGKKRSGDRERHQSPVQKAAKHSKKSTMHDSRKEEKKKGGDEGRPRVPKDSPPKEEEEDFEVPTMSFESFLTYDAPTSVKKKKKTTLSASSSSHSRPSHSSSSTSSSHRTRTPPPASSSSSSSSSKARKANGAQSTKRTHSRTAVTTPSKCKEVYEAVPTVPEIQLPAIQPNYRPLPSIDITPLSPQRRKVPVCNEEDDAGFTGKRFNSKMVVYSGSKTTYLPKMMTLYEQCIRVLQNNIDSIAEVGGVPFDILEPVLERCTPEQLYRIEQSNQWFTEESDELWMRHCRRDFKRESPQEYESWRELYLRLHDEREERLRMLTQNITSAHANKPKGRQVKMAYVNSVAKPPRDVRRRQEKFGTTSGSTASSTAAAAPIKIRPATTDYSGESSQSSSSQNNPPSAGSSRFSAPSGAGHAAREKPQVKKIAPMMAKTIKAFKNRFSRR